MDLKKGFFTLFLFFTFTFVLNAKVMEFKVSKQIRTKDSFKSACESMGFRDNLLIEPKGLIGLDCMGRVVKVNDYCLKKKVKGKLFLRGFLNAETKSVVCQFGNSANLTLSCETKKTRKYCESPKVSCEKLKNYFAVDLNVTHHSRLFEGSKEMLNCYFGKVNLELDKDLFEESSQLSL
ncbi:MAG: hypothetical protein KC493_05605 [Bacteriovoracaceae bacterium]|nr:hypothetical protein [Bacteriovoracaceae bacterium]